MNSPAPHAPAPPYPEAFTRISEDFSFLDDWDDRYRYLIDLGKTLAPLSEAEHNDATKVRGCASQVWLVFDEDAAAKTLSFRGDSDALIVRGLVAVVLALFSQQSPVAIMATDARDALNSLDLKEHITQQRSNGVQAMVQRIREYAAARV